MAQQTNVIQTRSLSSLVKVFHDEEIVDQVFSHASALFNETFSFQVAYKGTKEDLESFKVEIDSDLKDIITIRKVGLVQSDTPMYPDHDEHVLRTTPGLYPDPLFPFDYEGVNPVYDQWNSIWVTVHLNEQVKTGTHDIKVQFVSKTNEKLAEETFTLDVIPCALPEQKLIQTNWFHADCLATEYEVDVFSEAHWKLIDQYVETASKNGMNMLLTPLFTLPLDTEIGGERPTHQLVDVEKNGDTYTFNFDKLIRWIDLAKNQGIKYIEFSHFFTQWGALHAPKIIATEAGIEKQIFGWKTDASGEEYRDFLSQFLPALKNLIVKNDIEDMAYFHVSDEPTLDQLESYQKASEIVYEYLSDYPIIDALSNYEFYEKGLVKKPIPANNHMDDFLENNVPGLWTYYCCAQYKQVSNRFFSFPSARNRISGLQFYKYDIEGFLHWGYNFWFTQFSKKVINPYEVTDAGGSFPSGDAFLVYPGKEGPIESIRLAVFFDALQDLRALQLLESLTSKEHVMNLLEGKLSRPLTFTEYPRDSEWLLFIREQVNKQISEYCKA